MDNTTIYNNEFENDMTNVDNNSITLDFAAEYDDFDKLLDDFIRKSLEEDTDEDKKNENEGEEEENDNENDDDYENDEDDGDICLDDYIVESFELGGTSVTAHAGSWLELDDIELVY